MEHTKGKVEVIQNNTWPFTINIETENKHILSINMAHYSTADNTIDDVLKRDFTNNSEVIANAELIADAFNTTNESGLTPSLLYKQNQELLDALEKSKDKISELFTKGVDFAKINSELFTILEQAINNAKTK